MDRGLTNPKDSNIYRNGCFDACMTLKGSDVYRNDCFDVCMTLKGSDVYRNDCFDACMTLKGSDVYRNNILCFHSTPLGSHNSFVAFFYKYQIPSGLFLNNMEADIPKRIGGIKIVCVMKWKKVKLTDISKPKQWKNLPISELSSEGYAVYGANGIIGRYKEYNHEFPTLAITCRGATCGTINITEPKSYITSNAMALDDISEDVDQKFLYYALNKRGFKDVITGAAQPQITREGLSKITLDIPEKKENQLHIANLLNKAENLINQRKESIRLLDEFLKSTFLEMFGDPVRNEKGIPKSKIITLTNIGTGGTPSRKREAEFYNGKIPWVKTTEVNGSYISNTEEKITEAALKESNCKMYPVGTILIAMYGQGKTRGNVGVLKIEATTNQACAAILPSNNFNTIFLFQQLKQLYTSIRSMAKGSNQENLNLSIVGNIEILIPPLELQTQFAHIVEKTEALKTQYQQSLQELENLYGSLSQKAFKGELTAKQNSANP